MTETREAYEPPRVRGLKSELRDAEQVRDARKAEYEEADKRVVKLTAEIKDAEART